MVLPIKIQLNLHKIRLVNEELNGIQLEPTTKRHDNIQRSILEPLAKRMAKKQIDVFPSQKNFNFKLAYFEADILEEVLRVAMFNRTEKDEAFHTLRMIADDINQKLA